MGDRVEKEGRAFETQRGGEPQLALWDEMQTTEW